MKPAQVNPPLAGSEHDADGRLVGLAFDSTPPPQTPDTNPWLVAVDGSDNALRAVVHAADQTVLMKACALHLIHVQPWLSKEAADAELAHRALAASARARALLDDRSLPWRLHVAMGDAVERILAQAAQLHASVVIIGTRGLGVTESLLLGSVTEKIIHASKRPVLVVP